MQRRNFLKSLGLLPLAPAVLTAASTPEPRTADHGPSNFPLLPDGDEDQWSAVRRLRIIQDGTFRLGDEELPFKELTLRYLDGRNFGRYFGPKVQSYFKDHRMIKFCREQSQSKVHGLHFSAGVEFLLHHKDFGQMVYTFHRAGARKNATEILKIQKSRSIKLGMARFENPNFQYFLPRLKCQM